MQLNLSGLLLISIPFPGTATEFNTLLLAQVMGNKASALPERALHGLWMELLGGLARPGG